MHQVWASCDNALKDLFPCESLALEDGEVRSVCSVAVVILVGR
ncbi:hypothetical protein KSD_70070 [Ktedonobacter sp. SOSP1-85]|nr:hypothetical protein KSD_70070 [Ktedonobacter sp. SOSP1-85]